MKIRRQGRSLAVTLDAATLKAAHLHEGDLVQPTVENGTVVLIPVEVVPGVRREVMEIGRRVIEEDAPVLKRLAEYDSE